MGGKEYWFNGSWRTYEYIHSLGYTLLPPTIHTLYDGSCQQISIIEENDSGSHMYYINGDWYNDIPQEALLYRPLGEITLYKCMDGITYDAFTNSMLNRNNLFVKVNNNILPINTLYNESGITTYQCSPYYVKEGDIIIWYDSESNLYWNNDKDNMGWVTTPPQITESSGTNDVFIMPNGGRIELQRMWDDGSLPIIYRTYPLIEQDEYFNRPAQLKSFFEFYNHSDDVFKEALYLFYKDNIADQVTFYVVDQNGIDDYLNVHHSYGDTFTGSYKIVYVQSDAEVNFYLGEELYTFSETRDDDNNAVYLCDSAYMTLAELHSAGYTSTQSIITEIIIYNENITENWWLNSSEGGYYCRGNWYANEAALNNAGYYLEPPVFPPDPSEDPQSEDNPSLDASHAVEDYIYCL